MSVTRVDARGLSCPQPVLMTVAKLKELGSGEVEVLVDNESSRENVSRAAGGAGWEVLASENTGEEFRLRLVKK